MKNAALIVKPKGENLEDVVKKSIEILQKYDVSPMVEEYTITRFNLDIMPSTVQEMRRKADFVVVLGGDGTLLYTSRMFRLIDIPILAFNLGRLGFIIELSIDDFEATIANAVADKLIMKRRMKLTSEIFLGVDKIFEEEALNEVVISKGAPSRMLELNIYIDNFHVTKFRADGVIVATPTGSTGYTMSARGPIVHCDLDTIIISPICPHALNVSPIVVPKASVIKVKIENSDAVVAIDGQIVKPFSNEHIIKIKKSPVYACMATNNERNYYTVLRQKLGWGGEIC